MAIQNPVPYLPPKLQNFGLNSEEAKQQQQVFFVGNENDSVANNYTPVRKLVVSLWIQDDGRLL